jgi:adenylate cyclase
VTEARKQIWRDYGWSLLIAYLIAIGFAILMPAIVRQVSFNLADRVLMCVISGAFFGNAFFFVGFALPRLRFRSFLLTCLCRSLVTCLTMLAGMFVIVPISMSMVDKRVSLLSSRAWLEFWRVIPLGDLALLVLAGLALSMLINGIHQINRKLGPGIIKNWLTGKYHEPREEERIFMFLDLKNSTTLAEKLGNIRFSKLCQDFFHDLSPAVIETKGEVSHYIGDEAVLTWKPKKGLDKANCIRCYQIMEKQIAKRAAHYNKEYGITPEFKAGVHIGLVVAAEVGEIKSEIVYHGDVLNTTARISGLCSELGSDLLISGDLHARLTLPDELVATSFGPRLLKGKEHAVEIVKIAPASGSPAEACEPERVPTPIGRR